MAVRRPSNGAVRAHRGGVALGLRRRWHGIQTLSLPSVPSVGAISQQATAQPPSAPAYPATGSDRDRSRVRSGSATEIYSRMPRGAMSCWFTVGGPLKKDYIFHATADAPSRGGKAEIVIHQRDPSQPNPRGAKAYLIDIEPTGETSASHQGRKQENAGCLRRRYDGRRLALVERPGGMRGASTAAGWAPAPPETADAPAQPKAKKQEEAKTKPKAKPQAKPAATP